MAHIERICSDLETSLDELRSGKRNAGGRTVGLLLSALDGLRSTVDALPESPADGPGEGAEISARDNRQPRAEKRPLGEILVELGTTTAEEIERALEQQDRKLGEILISEGKVSTGIVEEALKLQRQSDPTDTLSFSSPSATPRAGSGWI